MIVTIIAIFFLSLSLPNKNCSGSASWSFLPMPMVAHAHSTTSPKRETPYLHNYKHESTIRNILQPSFDNGAPNNSLNAGNHTSNVAILVSSSRYWFNYRHVTNALSIYHLLLKGGYSHDNIVLMLADDIPCNMRNPFRGKIFPRGANGGMGEDLMDNVHIDYAGTDVTVDAFLRVLLGRHLPGEGGTPGLHRRSWPKLDENTNVLVYLTGHGGDNFFKFQDGEELTSMDVASAFSQMKELKRYNELLFISDTCQAFTMADEINVPNVYSVGSSLKGQNSYASHTDHEVGQSVIDRYSKIIKDFVDDAVTLTSFQSRGSNSDVESYGSGTLDNATIAVMERMNVFDALVRIPTMHGDLGPSSKVGHTDKLCSRRMNQVPMSDFFAAPLAERERQMGALQGSSTVYLWMNDMPSQVEGFDAIEQPSSIEECSVDSESISANFEQSVRIQKQKRSTGMSPFDPKFLAITVGFIVCVSSLSRIW